MTFNTWPHSLQVKKATWVPLSDAAADSCGAKAAACAALEHASGGKLFETPKGAVIPFGSMELALKVKHLPLYACTSLRVRLRMLLSPPWLLLLPLLNHISVIQTCWQSLDL